MLLCSRMILSRWNSWRWYFLLVLRRPIETTGKTVQVGSGTGSPTKREVALIETLALYQDSAGYFAGTLKTRFPF